LAKEVILLMMKD